MPGAFVIFTKRMLQEWSDPAFRRSSMTINSTLIRSRIRIVTLADSGLGGSYLHVVFLHTVLRSISVANSFTSSFLVYACYVVGLVRETGLRNFSQTTDRAGRSRHNLGIVFTLTMLQTDLQDIEICPGRMTCSHHFVASAYCQCA